MRGRRGPDRALIARHFLSGAGVGVSILGGFIRAELSHPITEATGRGIALRSGIRRGAMKRPALVAAIVAVVVLGGGLGLDRQSARRRRPLARRTGETCCRMARKVSRTDGFARPDQLVPRHPGRAARSGVRRQWRRHRAVRAECADRRERIRCSAPRLRRRLDDRARPPPCAGCDSNGTPRWPGSVR